MNIKHEKLLAWCGCLIVLAVFVDSSRFADSSEAMAQEATELQAVVETLKTAIRKKDLSSMRPYVSGEDKLYWATCHVNGDYESYSIDEMISLLSRYLKDSEIDIQEVPVKRERSWEIRTRGWAGEEPFVSFFFRRIGDSVRWWGICSAKKAGP